MSEDRRPYRPSNSTEGDWFESQWCNRCRDNTWNPESEAFEAEPCGIWGLGIAGEAPEQWVTGGGAGPRCTAFRAHDDDRPEPFDSAAAIGTLL